MIRISSMQSTVGTLLLRLLRAIVFILVGLAASVAVQAASYSWPAPGQDVVGALQYTRSTADDTLLDIARRFDVGYQAIIRANPTIDPWLPGAGSKIVVPTLVVLPHTAREGIVVNLAEMRLYYFNTRGDPSTWTVDVFPVGIGRMNWGTPLGVIKISAKIKDPVWYPPLSIRTEHAQEGLEISASVPPGPDNPLGNYALRLGDTKYLIHGTNKPFGIGMRVSHGCIRLYPEDIESLFAIVERGTPVRIVNQAYKAGWHGHNLLFEAHPPLKEDPDRRERNKTPAIRTVMDATPTQHVKVSWDAVVEAVRRADGIPRPVGHSTQTTDPTLVLDGR